MKKLLGIVVLGLLLSSNVYANSLVGKKLECTTSSKHIRGPIFYEFINNKHVKEYYIDNKSLKVGEGLNAYDAYPETIDIFIMTSDIKMYSIDRKTLKTSNGNQCEVINMNIKITLEQVSKELLEMQTKDNKI